MGSAVVFLDGTVVNVALPAIRDDLGSGLAAQQWVVGANNAIARVASLLAIAAVGAVVSTQFDGTLDERLAGTRLTPAERTAVAEAKRQPLASPAGPSRTAPAIEDASVSAYRWGTRVGGLLVVVGGLISLVGIANPPRTLGAAAQGDHGGPSQLVHPCPEGRRSELPEPVGTA